MPIAPSTRLGPYEILARIGAGGMGEVYRARDTRLDRIVAVKVLTAEFSQRPDLRQRFEREARAVSSLNHPHICVLHDVGHQSGIDYLVMEHLDGETLAARLARGPVPLEEALRLGRQILDALDLAHRHGIVHRDLKPGNVMITKAGAKLLDFGLAKMDAGLKPANPPGEGPTQTQALTSEGALIGTFRYMAPEQLEAREADARTDIFAFGVVFYEMITGRRAFDGASQASLIASILRAEPPPVSSLQPLSSPALDKIANRCLAKDPDERWQSVRDLGAALEFVSAPAAPAATPQPARPWLAWTVAAGALIVAAAAGGYFSLRPAIAERMVRLSVHPPAGSRFRFIPNVGGSAISPDGAQIAFCAPLDGTSTLWLRPLDSQTSKPLPGTAGAYYPFWSPDGRSIGFFTIGKLKRIDLASGAVRDLADAGEGRGAAWLADASGKSEGTIVFSSLIGPLMRVPAEGGTARPLRPPEASRDEVVYQVSPSALPGGKIVYLGRTAQGFEGALYVTSVDSAGESTDRVRLIEAASGAHYAPPWRGSPGHLLTVTDGTLLAYRFDPATLRLDRPPSVVAEGVGHLKPLRLADFSVSTNGVLVHGSAGFETTIHTWLGRDGKPQGTAGEPGLYNFFEISPDGSRAAIGRVAPETGVISLWVIDTVRGVQTRVSFPRGEAHIAPVWSPDGKRIAFSAREGGPFRIHVQPAGGGESIQLTTTGGTQFVYDWSRDGRYIAFSETTERGVDIWVLPMLPAPGNPVPYLKTPFHETYPKISPDGRRLAYSSNESGRFEIYLQDFPVPGNRVQVSTNGGTQPRWRGDGGELYFLAGNRLMAVAITPGKPAFEVGVPKEVFTWDFASSYGNLDYDAAADGRRFLVRTPVDPPKPLNVVLNWQAGLKR